MADPVPAATARLPLPRRLLRLLPLLLVWAVALWPVVLWAAVRSDAEAAVQLARTATLWATWAALGGALFAIVGLLVYPPFPAWIRLVFDRAKSGIASDRGPLLRALADLQHFESGARHFEAGRLALQRGELPLAQRHLVRAVELEPAVPGHLHHFGLLLVRLGDLRQALLAFAKAEELDPGHAFGEALLQAGRCASGLGDHATARALLEQHAARHGGSRKSHYWLGKVRQCTGDPDGARAAMRFAAAPTKARLTAEENWFRALARVWLWRGGAS